MGKVVKDIRVALSGEELAKLATEMSENIMRCEAIEEQKRIVTADLTSALKNEKKAYRAKAKAYRDGHEYRPVDCEEVPNFETNIVAVKRMDTGEILETRAMRAEERQTAIEFPDGKPAAPEVAPKKGGSKKRVTSGAPLTLVPDPQDGETTAPPAEPKH